MSILAVEVEPIAIDVVCKADSLDVILADGREIKVPLEWFPRLKNATAAERQNWRMIGNGYGIHWEDVDEDISIESLLRFR